MAEAAGGVAGRAVAQFDAGRSISAGRESPPPPDAQMSEADASAAAAAGAPLAPGALDTRPGKNTRPAPLPAPRPEAPRSTRQTNSNLGRLAVERRRELTALRRSWPPGVANVRVSRQNARI